MDNRLSYIGVAEIHELDKLKERNMAKRIKAKTKHLRGAAWHAAREGNKIVMTNVKDLQDDAAKAQQEAVAIVPPNVAVFK